MVYNGVRFGIGKRVGLHHASEMTALRELRGEMSFACRVCGFRLFSQQHRRRHERDYHRIMAAASRQLDCSRVRRLPPEALACPIHRYQPFRCGRGAC